MKKGTKQIIEVAISSDPTIETPERRKLKDLLSGKVKKDRLITTKEACLLLGCAPISLGRYEKRGYLFPVRYSQRKKRWRESELLEFLETGIAKEVK